LEFLYTRCVDEVEVVKDCRRKASFSYYIIDLVKFEDHDEDEKDTIDYIIAYHIIS